MIFVRNLSALLLIAIFATATSYADDEVTIQEAIPFSKNLMVPQAVRRDCQLPTKLAMFIKKYAAKYRVNVKMTSGSLRRVRGRVLDIKIINILGTGGGAWSGAKFATIKGRLTENGRLRGSFIAARATGGGAFGGFKGTCSLLGRVVKALGKDVGRWLQNPSIDARLGQAPRN